ncbi:hypothetical protein JYK00_09455 [Thermosipho ferrireducens]|uniref:Uncharacterized protein n=1 Tax=Thermosipho ferrireducens TaxID=2571116 RepID=A0ABX7S7P0_9BACT|nr:hypothetical protein [Thermosipho ferrireducens]QTA37928.1 hypothetical protein JYK00_09455 [Thermosipho ferrireducens]
MKKLPDWIIEEQYNEFEKWIDYDENGWVLKPNALQLVKKLFEELTEPDVIIKNSK